MPLLASDLNRPLAAIASKNLSTKSARQMLRILPKEKTANHYDDGADGQINTGMLFQPKHSLCAYALLASCPVPLFDVRSFRIFPSLDFVVFEVHIANRPLVPILTMRHDSNDLPLPR